MVLEKYNVESQRRKFRSECHRPVGTFALKWIIRQQLGWISREFGCEKSTDEWIKKLWYIYTMEYYWAIKKNAFESVLIRWMNIEPILQSEVSQKEKNRYGI